LHAKLRAKRIVRITAIVLVLAYAWLSSVVSFQHTEDFDAFPAARSAHAAPAGHTRLASAQSTHPGSRCITCEWQSANVSAAISVYAIPHWYCAIPASECGPPLAPHNVSVLVSARAPPAA
jgi:hypothetical protein